MSASIKLCVNGNLMYDKVENNNFWKKGGLFVKWSWNNLLYKWNKVNLEIFFAVYTKISTSWIEHSNLKCKP